MTDIKITARGDEWLVDHPSIDRTESYDDFGAAHGVAQRLSNRIDASVQIQHPRNVNLRELHS